MRDGETEVNMVVDAKDAGSEVYEFGYLLVPTISEEDLPMQYGNLKELIITSGASVISDEMPKMITLAYAMQKVISNIRHKFTTAYFGWVKFTLDRQAMIQLKKKLDLDPTLLRFLIVKTVKENTIAGKRFVRDEGKRIFNPRKTTDETITTPIDKEKIDKEIDALVASN